MSIAASIARRMLGQRRPARAPAPTRRGDSRERPTAPVQAAADVLPPHPPDPPAPLPGWSTSCKAVDAATGRQCALLHGHPGAHRHGSTRFVAVVLDDADLARAKARLDEAAQRRLNPQSIW